MTGFEVLGLSLEQWAAVAAIVGAVVAVVGAVVAVVPPIRVFLARWRLFNPWILTKKQRLESERDILAANAMKSAILKFALRWNPDPSLVISNTGKCDARNVKVWGYLSQRYFYMGDDGKVRTHRLVGDYNRLLPGASTSEAVNNVDYQIEGGAGPASRWKIRASWDDDVGRHRDVDFVAKLAEPNPA
jgi:hypothetical protein